MTAHIDTSKKVINHKRLFTVEEYYKMGKAGIFDDERVELINGIIYYMSPVGSPHRGCVAHLYEELLLQFQGKFFIAAQDPISCSDNSEPEPDIAVLKFRKDKYKTRHPKPEDVHLLVEVADSTLEKDRTIKKAFYAQEGIIEYWIANIPDQQIEIFRHPKNNDYQEKIIMKKGESATCETIGFALSVDDLFEYLP